MFPIAHINVVHGDMCDLSMFSEDAFDIVEHPISICFIPDVRKVYREVFRVLRPRGFYRVAHLNPAVCPAACEGGHNGWDGVGYRISEPYAGGAWRRNAEGIENMLEGTPTGEFRHLFSDIFNGLIEVGFEIRNVFEDPRHLRSSQDAEPGSEAHRLGIIAEYLIILARKRGLRPAN